MNKILITLLALLIPLILAPSLILLERRLLALWQARLGPNRVGPWGSLQVLADAIKLLFKEDWIPPFANKLFILAPAIIIVTILLSFALIPWTSELLVFDSSVSLLLFFALSSLSAYSVVIGGWSSRNTYALIGSMRAIGQLIAYELFMGLSLMGVVARSSSFNLKRIVMDQAVIWNVVPQFLGFVVFFIASLAELRRLPFDLPEAESEIVAGYHSEYSGFKFGMFFIGEYLGLLLMSSMMTILFFGGWLGPILPPLIWFLLKTLLLITIIILLRASLPRPRLDQLLGWGWKVLMPLSLLNLLVTGFFIIY